MINDLIINLYLPGKEFYFNKQHKRQPEPVLNSSYSFCLVAGVYMHLKRNICFPYYRYLHLRKKREVPISPTKALKIKKVQPDVVI